MQPREEEEGDDQGREAWEQRRMMKEEEDRLVKERIGPDGFWVQVEGAERVGKELVDCESVFRRGEGECS